MRDESQRGQTVLEGLLAQPVIAHHTTIQILIGKPVRIFLLKYLDNRLHLSVNTTEMAIINKNHNVDYKRMHNIRPDTIGVGTLVKLKSLSDIRKYPMDPCFYCPKICGIAILDGMQTYAGDVATVSTIIPMLNTDGIRFSRAHIKFVENPFTWPIEIIDCICR